MRILSLFIALCLISPTSEASVSTPNSIDYFGTNKKAILMIHGFIGSPQTFGQLPAFLNKRGYSIHAPLLPKHGQDATHLEDLTKEEMMNFVETEYLALKAKYEEVIVIGFSLGGTLALMLSTKHPIDRMILISPFFDTKYGLKIIPTENLLAFVSPVMRYISMSDAQGGKVPNAYIQETLRLGKIAQESYRKAQIKELIIIHGDNDQTASLKPSKRLCEELVDICKEFHLVESGGHMLLLDTGRDKATEIINKFI